MLKTPSQRPTSVGAMLNTEYLEPLGTSQAQLAKAMGVSGKTVNELCSDKRGVTAEIAFLLAKVLGTTPDFWMNLQLINDIWLAEHDNLLSEKLDHARPLVSTCKV